MSQVFKAESQWNKVFHERPTENSEESFFYQFIRKTTEMDFLFTAQKIGTGSGIEGGRSLIRTVSAGASPHFPGNAFRTFASSPHHYPLVIP